MRLATKKKYKYFAATTFGEMPTTHKCDAESVRRDLEFCRKGWPDKQWTVYEIIFEKPENEAYFHIEKLRMQVEDNAWQEFLVPDILTSELDKRYPKKRLIER